MHWLLLLHWSLVRPVPPLGIHLLVFDVPSPVSQYVDWQSEFPVQVSPRLPGVEHLPGCQVPKPSCDSPPHARDAGIRNCAGLGMVAGRLGNLVYGRRCNDGSASVWREPVWKTAPDPYDASHLVHNRCDEVLLPQDTAIQHQSVSLRGGVENHAPAWHILVVQILRRRSFENEAIPIHDMIPVMNLELSVSSGTIQGSALDPKFLIEEKDDADLWRNSCLASLPRHLSPISPRSIGRQTILRQEFAKHIL
jgi:hypothetical protein